jgi:hypothetical protein
VNIFLKALGAKQRNEIKNGKLWTITRLWGMDISRKEQAVAQPLPFVKPQGGRIEMIQTHMIKDDDNVTNLTKQPDLM